jgi:hypothetical protein
VSPLSEAQTGFAKALLDPRLPAPPDLRSLGMPAGDERFAVYRNNVMVGLIEGLRDAYPVVCRLVGDEFFRAMAGIFARVHPPRSPVMLEYGDGFAVFIVGFPPAASVPYLVDVARLERAWVEAYHAADAEPLTSPIRREAGQLRLHPAARLVRSPFAVLRIWEANQPDAEPQPLELTDEGENVLVTRPAAEVQASRIPDEAADVIEAVAAGEPVGSSEHLERLASLGAFAAAGPVA